MENVPFTGGRRLPKARPDGQQWNQRTRQKWRAWSTMPHCVLWHPSDWEFALTAAVVADEFYRTGKATYAAELRHWERVMAVTMDDRRSQRILYIDPRPPVAPVQLRGPEDFRDL
ncbi:hypothetical protein AWB98_18050 [Mycolicibacterium conceptionense]|uniref:Uncharacterized protein n=1 Tax=Mycolicibacterium conceptionense TaxID=451644 RepID=A0ABX3V5M8_9MYCO|nr:hypothetical protein AWB98_18050 [Mycolicibacterium conceptionense]